MFKESGATISVVITGHGPPKTGANALVSR
jgi:hypothetical protein